MSDRLPRTSVADWEGWAIRCPWCRADVGEATVTLDALLCAHHHDQLKRPARQWDQTRDEAAVVVNCPVCARPSMLALADGVGGHPNLRLVPVRTATDAAFQHDRLMQSLRSDAVNEA